MIMLLYIWKGHIILNIFSGWDSSQLKQNFPVLSRPKIIFLIFLKNQEEIFCIFQPRQDTRIIRYQGTLMSRKALNTKSTLFHNWLLHKWKSFLGGLFTSRFLYFIFLFCNKPISPKNAKKFGVFSMLTFFKQIFSKNAKLGFKMFKLCILLDKSGSLTSKQKKVTSF